MPERLACTTKNEHYINTLTFTFSLSGRQFSNASENYAS